MGGCGNRQKGDVMLERGVGWRRRIGQIYSTGIIILEL